MHPQAPSQVDLLALSQQIHNIHPVLKHIMINKLPRLIISSLLQLLNKCMAQPASSPGAYTARLRDIGPVGSLPPQAFLLPFCLLARLGDVQWMAGAVGDLVEEEGLVAGRVPGDEGFDFEFGDA